ncbi:DUF3291 domain-containing protein [Simiduia litorea]|uniref:DUF3291 domain-containing protein n=1 Tax=Simiduia litorea TaxID=1435348 RepID=UPI0036F41959
MDRYHLAQINIARARDAMDSETMTGFVSRLDEINALADAAPGFIWRLQTADGDATSIQAFDDPLLIVNMSVWADRDALRAYVYKSLHVELIRDRDAWFEKIAIAHQALWWVPHGHTPTVEEGKARLQHLEEHGPTTYAFTFAKPFDPV